MEELRKIKKLYGEKMSHFCRENFPTILENEGVLLDILTKNFHPSRELYEDLMTLSQIEEHKDILDNFKSYIFTKFNRFQVSVSSTKSPKELLLESGYDLYECHSNEEVQKFKKYYAPGEELCTFNRDRTERCHVFFAVKKNAHELKRSDFKNPKRQDEYGTSVISIQFTKDDSCTLSIKNRYNHTVDSCDATFSNDLDNIIEGLTDSFEKEYGLVQQFRQGQFEIPNYVKANDGKFYKYNVEIDNIYYCRDNVIIDNFKVKMFDKSQYLLMDYFLLDLVNKTVNLYDEFLLESFQELTDNIIKIEIIKQDKDKIVKLTHSNGTFTNITLKQSGCISKLESNRYKIIDRYFLMRLTHIQEVILYEVEIIDDYFLQNAISINLINCPKVREIRNNCFKNNKNINTFNFPVLKIIGDNFFESNTHAAEIILPEVEEIGNNFFAENENLENIYLSKVKRIGNLFLYKNSTLKEINFPEVLIIGDSFCQYGESIEYVNMPKLKKMGDYCLEEVRIKNIELNSLEIVGERFMTNNEKLENFSFDALREIGDRFLLENKNVEEVNLPSAISIGEFFMTDNLIVKVINMPNVVCIGNYFISHNRELQEINFPKVVIIKDNFIIRNQKIKYVNIPMIEEIGKNFLRSAENIEEMYTSKQLEEFIVINCSAFNGLVYDGNGRYVKMSYDYDLDLSEGQGRK